MLCALTNKKEVSKQKNKKHDIWLKVMLLIKISFTFILYNPGIDFLTGI